MFALFERIRVQCYFAQIILTIVVFVVLQNNYVNSKNLNKNKVYYFENELFVTWVNALNICKNMSMSLFTVRNKDEFDYLRSLIGMRYNQYLPWWLDAYKLEGVWKWISSGDNITEFFWHEGEPNDKSGHEKCIHTWGEFFDWNDNDCERELPFICEAENI